MQLHPVLQFACNAICEIWGNTLFSKDFISYDVFYKITYLTKLEENNLL